MVVQVTINAAGRKNTRGVLVLVASRRRVERPGRVTCVLDGLPRKLKEQPLLWICVQL